jgi:hypothetical protein
MIGYVILGLIGFITFAAWWKLNRQRPGEPPIVGGFPFFGCIVPFATDSIGLLHKSYKKVFFKQHTMLCIVVCYLFNNCFFYDYQQTQQLPKKVG